MSQLMVYDQFAPLLLSTARAEHVEYVIMSHPDFECICYWLGRHVLSVKLSDNKTEKYVFVLNSEWSNVVSRLETLRISVVAIN